MYIDDEIEIGCKVLPTPAKTVRTLELKIGMNLSLDFKFWAFLPALNFNGHTKTLELEFLCFSIYVDIE